MCANSEIHQELSRVVVSVNVLEFCFVIAFGLNGVVLLSPCPDGYGEYS